MNTAFKKGNAVTLSSVSDLKKVLGKRRNGEIELLRFIFAICVFCLHGSFRFGGRGYLGVEFFFMLSGALMARSLERDNKQYRAEPISATYLASMKYLLRRIGAIYPYYAVSTLIGTVVLFLAQRNPIIFAWLPWDLLILQNYGFPAASGTGVEWYLSSMFFAIWLLYPLLRRYYDIYSHYLAPMVFFLITGSLLRLFGTLEVPCDWYGLLNTGFLRAIADMSLGITVYAASKYLRKLLAGERSLGPRILATVTEGVLLIGLVLFLGFGRPLERLLDALAPLAIAIVLTIVFSERSLFAGKLDHPFTEFLGRASTIVFLNHVYWFIYFPPFLERLGYSVTPGQLKLIGIFLSICSSVVVWVVGNWLKRLFRHLI